MDHRVGADLDVRIDVGRGRIDERDAGGHQFFVLLLSHDSAHFRQFGAAVDAPDFLGVVDHERFDRQLPPAVDGDQVGQVVLALRVLRRDAAKRVEQRRQVEGVDAAVDFLESAAPLGEASRSSTIRAMRPFDADDPAVAVRAVDCGRDHRRCGVGATVGLHEPAAALRASAAGRRPTAGRPSPSPARKHRLRLLERMGGSELRLLNDEPQIQVVLPIDPYRRLQPWPTISVTVAGTIARPRSRSTCSMSGRPAMRMQHFRQAGLHPGALAGGENDDMYIGGIAFMVITTNILGPSR